ncbi:MAG: DUF3108 domain-containing protein [Bacteroidales bacterium]|nr:DUF3108 domain-containing protein [Bacteroidales bacterium]
MVYVVNNPQKCVYVGVWVFLTLSLNTFAQTYKPIRILPNTFFKGGEKLVYQLRYGIIVGGKVTLTLEDKGNTYHVRGEAVTTGLADEIFSVKDVYESYFEKESNLPVFAIQNVKEGKRYKYYNETIFDRKNNKVISSRSGTHEVPPDIIDMMCVFYYIRRIDLTDAVNGDSYKINTFFSDKIFPFEIRYRGKEIITTKFGKISCLKFAPIVEPGRVFKSKDDMLIWFTDDANRIPILVSMQMVVGHVYCELIDMQNLLTKPVFMAVD